MGDLDFRTIIAFAAIPSTTMLGCVAAYVYSDQKGLKSSTKFLADLFPNRSSVFYLRADFVMSVLIGTCIAIILYSPTTGYQALAAGVGWTTAFNILKAEKPGNRQNEGSTEEN